MNIKFILELHLKWLNNEKDGERANLKGINLEGANLEGVNLEGVNLKGANLEGANLEGVNLKGANLKDANLEDANLEGVNLKGANLKGANLEGANLEGVNLDFSQLNLSCKGLNFNIDKKIARQLAYHLINLCNYSKLDYEEIINTVNESHLIDVHKLPKLELNNND